MRTLQEVLATGCKQAQGMQEQLCTGQSHGTDLRMAL
jgi:hypothetical protein